MTTVQNGSLTGTDIPVPNRWTFADATARGQATDPLTAVGYSVADIGKFAFQASNDTFWRLATTTPTWTAVASLPQAATVSAIPFIRWFKASALPIVSDGTALASWLDSAGSGDPAIQSSGGTQPAYKIAANGINGVPVVRFGGSQYLRTLHGGAAIAGTTTPWYMSAVLRLTSTGQNSGIIEFGDDVGSHRRAMMFLADSRGLSFNGNGSDVAPPGQPAYATSTPYFAEFAYDGVMIWCSLNGQLRIISQPSTPFQASSNDPITIGANNSGGENFSGDLAEVMILNRMPTRAETAAIRSYIATTYGMVFPTTAPWLALTGAGSSTGISGASEAAGPLIYQGMTCFGSDDQLITGLSSFSAPNLPAQHSFRGAVAMDASGANAEHSFAGNSGANVANVWNKNAVGYSAYRFLNSSGMECGAIGVANSSSSGPFKRTAQGTLYLEASGFQDETNAGTFAFVQTNGSGELIRYEFLVNGDMVFYDFNDVEIYRIPQQGGIILAPRPVAPTSPSSGMIYFDSVANKLKLYASGAWQTVTSS